MTLESKIELHHKFTRIQLQYLVSKIMLTLEPPAYVNGEGISNYFRIMTDLENAEKAMVELIEEVGDEVARELLSKDFIEANGLKMASEAQRPMVKEFCGKHMSIDELVEWAQEQKR